MRRRVSAQPLFQLAKAKPEEGEEIIERCSNEHKVGLFSLAKDKKFPQPNT